MRYPSKHGNLQEKFICTRMSGLHWSTLRRYSVTTELTQHDFMVTYMKAPSLKDLLVRAKIAHHPKVKSCYFKIPHPPKVIMV